MERRYWIVSPNVKADNRTVGEWRSASIRLQSAFMGWQPDDQGHNRIGPRFAGEKPSDVQPGDVILIARRYRGAAEIVGFGVVEGKAVTTFPRNELPKRVGSSRRLNPFVPWSRPPKGLPLLEAMGHTMALAQLRPKKNAEHKQVIAWLDTRLSSQNANKFPTNRTSIESAVALIEPQIVDLENNNQLDYQVATTAAVRTAQRQEAMLVARYAQWLKRQGREIKSIIMGGLRCDAYEEARDNLIEAKQSAERAYVRMAVGQLLDYQHACRNLKNCQLIRLAVLLPSRPTKEIEAWLIHLRISLIWEDGAVFLDNSNGQFS